ncbi:MAG: hypothetical protein Q4C60_12020 [Eubacteriales bacterium]|nr:hypothetical protein [Eubacteriales bacterium]
MTNEKKFEEVFGIKVKRERQPCEDYRFRHCEATPEGFETGICSSCPWWREEYKEPRSTVEKATMVAGGTREWLQQRFEKIT